jgi:hypothetical protein
MGQQQVSNGAPGAAGASRTKSALRVRAFQAVRLRSDFVQGIIFSRTLRFGLDGPPLRCGSVKAQALRGNEKIIPCPGVPPGLEAPVFVQENIVCFLPTALGLAAYTVVELFRTRNANLFDRWLSRRFTRSMVDTDNAGSKLFASDTRYAMRFLAFGQKHGSTWQGGGHPLRCILPLCRERHADTVPAFAPRYRGQLRQGRPVSAPSAARGSSAAIASVSWRLRP